MDKVSLNLVGSKLEQLLRHIKNIDILVRFGSADNFSDIEEENRRMSILLKSLCDMYKKEVAERK